MTPAHLRPRRGIILTASTLAAMIGSVLLASPPAVGAPEHYDINQTLLSDNFSRAVASGLGTTASGSNYTTTNKGATVSVVDGAARISMKAGDGTVNSVTTVSATDARAAVDFSLSELPRSGNGTSTSLALRTSGNNSYTATVRMTSSGKIAIKIQRTLAGVPTTLLADQVVAKGGTANTAYRFMFQATGSNPVELAARAYPVSEPVPAWQAKAYDSSSSRLAAAGYPQLNSYQSTSSSATTVSYDNFAVATVTKAAAPSPSPTPTPAPPTPTPPTPEPPTPGDGSTPAVGSLPVGKATYPVPTSAIYVAPKGDSSGVGSATNPYGSLATALAKAKTGATIVLRAGTYHESVEVPFYKALTIQNFPNEPVWLDGASEVTGWSKSGSTWRVSGWNYNFDRSVSFTKGQDQTSWWTNPSYPMAGHPDQVWVNGAQLTQVSSASAVSSGKFYVDRTNKQLVIGTDPSGKTVEASTLQKAMTVHGAGTTLRGFGVKRYATTVNQMGAISLEVADLSAENLTISDNATIGLVTWGKNLKLNRLSLLRNGLLGGMITSDYSVVTNSDVSFNNTESFNEKPVAGGIKVGQMSHATFKGNLFEGNKASNGLWFDSSSYDITVAGNTFLNNGYDGLEVEISDTARVVNNYAIGNASAGIRVFDTSHAEVWNNTIAANRGHAIELMQDNRRSGKTPVTFLMSSVNFRNNVVDLHSGIGCPLLFQDTTSTYTGAQLGVGFESNAYYRSSNSATINFFCWPVGKTGIKGYKSLAAFQAATGNDQKSQEITGTPILNASYRLTSAAKTAVGSVASPVDSKTAGLLGVDSGWRGLGAQADIIRR